MDSHLERVAENWEQVARHSNPSQFICPANDSGHYVETGRECADRLARVIPRDKTLTIIEFGCGNGRVTRHLAERYGMVIAVDISPTMLEHVKQLNLPNVHLVLSNGLDLSRRIRAQAVYSECVLYHNSIADGAAILKELSGSLCVGGTIAIDLPVFEIGREPGNWTDVGTWTPMQFREACAAAHLHIASPLNANPGAFDGKTIGPYQGVLHKLVKIGPLTVC